MNIFKTFETFLKEPLSILRENFIQIVSIQTGNIFANNLTGFMTWLIQGMPIVVLLMILYYIIFAKSPIDGVWVSIFAFTLTFGSSVFAMLKSGVSA